MGADVRPRLAILLVLAACSPQQEADGNRSESQSRSFAGRPLAFGGLSGLYESGAAPDRSQMCILRRGHSTQFGLVVRKSPTDLCSGSGVALSVSGGIEFRMNGDSRCRIRGRISGQKIIFPAMVERGCAYYCGGRADLANIAFARMKGGRRAARSARDLVGEPLCTNE